MKTRSALDCGCLLPLSHGPIPTSRKQSARGLAQSKTWRFWLAAFCFVLGAFCFPAHAQTYSIDWFTIDGGGGTSTGGVYSVSGTIGQPDAGTMSGGNYSLTGAFWSLFAVQMPGAPLLSIALTATNTALVSWPSPSTGFKLQQNTNGIASVNWSNVVATPNDNGTINFIIVNPPAGTRFYRLLKP